MAVNIPKLLAKHLGSRKELGIGPLTLTKVMPGTRDPANLAGGNRPTTTSYPCKGFRDTKNSTYVAPDGDLVRVADVTIVILGGTLPKGVEPMAGDTITRKGVVYTIVNGGVTSDPVGATFTCVCRAPGG